MNCDHIEPMLAALAGGDLGGDDAARVRTHVAACASCREALATFMAIERSLVSRRDEVPAVDRFLPAFAPAPARAEASRPSSLVRVFRAAMSLPGVAILLVLWGGMFVFTFRHRAEHVTEFTSLDRLTSGINTLTTALVSASGNDAWMLTGVYVLIALAVLAYAGAVTRRALRS